MAFNYSFDELSVALAFAIGAAPSASAPAPAAGAPQKQQKQPKQQKKQEDDDMDLFGDDDAEEQTAPKESMAERAKRMKAEKEAKKKQDAKAERSQLVFEVKPVDTEVDLHALFREITKTQKEGLTWGEGYELKPVAFGINKLVMSCVIIDELVGMDDVTEPIEAMDEFVQSVDVNTMNKM